MTTTEAVPGKKVKLEVFAEDAPILREQGQQFWNALIGKTIRPEDHVVFGKMILDVKATKPKGPIKVMKDTAIKMSVAKQRPTLACTHCGEVHQSPEQNTCTNCGANLEAVTL